MSFKSGDGFQFGLERFQKTVDVRFRERSMQAVHRNDDGIGSNVMEPEIAVTDRIGVSFAEGGKYDFTQLGARS